MLKSAVTAAILLACIVTAEARPKLDPSCGISGPNAPTCLPVSASSPQAARETRGRFIARSMGFGAPALKRAGRVRKGRETAIPGGAEIAGFSPVIEGKSLRRSASSAEAIFGYGISQPLRYIAGRLVCAVNVNSALAERGIKGTGSALAHSFDHWGIRIAGPMVGAVAITDRRGGGHVAIVSRVEGSRVWVWNATGGHRGWNEIEYTNRHARYRIAA